MDATHPLAGRRVFVTGAGGFIGSHLAEALVRSGARVRAFVRYGSTGAAGWLDHLDPRIHGEIEIARGDLRDVSTVAAGVAGADVVFHLGALVAIPWSYQAPDAYVSTNVVGTMHVLEACRRYDVPRIVHASTSEVYGTAQYVPIDERHPLHPQSPYAASKSAADQLALSYQLTYGTPVVVVRPFNTYGPRQSMRAIVPTIAAQLLAGTSVRLGSLDPTRDLTYVSDTVDGFTRAGHARAVEGRTIQLGTGRETRIGDLAEMVARVVGVPLRIEQDPQRVRPLSSEVERLIADNALARELLGWSPSVRLEDGLARTVEWLRSSGHVQRAHEYAR
jgi:dTDP-glucose 4,6-dehydratase